MESREFGRGTSRGEKALPSVERVVGLDCCKTDLINESGAAPNCRRCLIRRFFFFLFPLFFFKNTRVPRPIFSIVLDATLESSYVLCDDRRVVTTFRANSITVVYKQKCVPWKGTLWAIVGLPRKRREERERKEKKKKKRKGGKKKK